MKMRRFTNMTAVAVLTLGAFVLATGLRTPLAVHAQDTGNNDEEQPVKIGYAIAPVPLNLEGKNPEHRRLVGLGSFIVNAQADCNGCHTAGAPPNFNYANNANPYFLNQRPTKTDPTTYLAGGSPFGQAVPAINTQTLPSWIVRSHSSYPNLSQRRGGKRDRKGASRTKGSGHSR